MCFNGLGHSGPEVPCSCVAYSLGVAHVADVDHLKDLLDCPRWAQKLGTFEHKEFLVFAVLYDMKIWPSIFQLFYV